MTEGRHVVVALRQLERYPDMSGSPVLMPLRRRFGVTAFGLNCWTAAVGEPVIERHSEPDGDEEVYVVVTGRVRFTVAEDVFEAGPETVVYVPPDTQRQGVALEPETLVLAIGAKPDKAFEAKSWEDFQVAFATAYAKGEDEARALLANELARNPTRWQPPYNAACFEVLVGDFNAALDHLAHALDLGPSRVRKLAAASESFIPLHTSPRWQELFE